MGKRYIQPLMTTDYRAGRDTLHDSLYAALQYLNQACGVIESCTPTFDEQREAVNACRLEIIACIKEIAR